MITFHGDDKIKEKYLSRVREHIRLENLVRGAGWEQGKGCAVGCTLENYDHYQYPIEIGIPRWLAILEDKLFEAMSLEKSKTWPEVFLEVIPVGIECSLLIRNVRSPFLIYMLEECLTSCNHDSFPSVKKCIDNVISLLKNSVPFGDIRWSEAARAARAARAAAAGYAAAAAADAAAAAADAAAAAGYAAAAAADAADVADYAAADAAAAAADAAADAAAAAADAAAAVADAAAYVAAYVADYAAAAAAATAEAAAYVADYAAAAAADAAAAAGYAAAAAADAADVDYGSIRSNKYDMFADKLIELLKGVEK